VADSPQEVQRAFSSNSLREQSLPCSRRTVQQNTWSTRTIALSPISILC